MTIHVKDIIEDGFSLDNRKGAIASMNNLASLSLNAALKAYFSTYSDMRYNLSIIEDKTFGQENIDANYLSSYCADYFETILHFHHFIELAMKSILREEHALLVDIVPKKHVILYKLLMKEALSDKEKEAVKSIEFKEALDRICELLKNNKISDVYSFIESKRDFLHSLNGIRNRLLHKGTFIMRYPALDKLVGGYILPFCNEVLSTALFTDIRWYFKKLHCGINPVDEIIKVIASDNYDLGR